MSAKKAKKPNKEAQNEPFSTCKKTKQPPLKHLFESVAKEIKQAEHILLVTDTRSDGDTFGSSLAFAKYLQANNKKTTHFATTPPTESLKFLPGIETIGTSKEILQDETIDLVIAFDTSRTEFIDEQLNTFKNKITIIIFDHHATNEGIGDISVINANASSTCELVNQYFKDRKVELTPDISKCLLTGIMTDTGILTNTATSHDSILAAGNLLETGGSIKAVINNIVNSTSINQLQLWGIVFGRLTTTKDKRLAVTYITRQDLQKTNTTEEDYFEIMDYMSATLKSEVIMFLKELEKGRVKVSLRSHNRDVSVLAKAFGGGGHKTACGFRL